MNSAFDNRVMLFARRRAAIGAGDASLPIEAALHVIDHPLAFVALQLGQADALLEERTRDGFDVALDLGGSPRWSGRRKRHWARGAIAQG